MSKLQYNLISHGEQSNLTVFVNGEMHVADNNHPNWQAIVAAVISDDSGVVNLFDSAKAVQTKFESLTDRVSVKGSVIYLDGDPIDGVLVDHILAFLSEGLEFAPLVQFLENVQQNPQQESRDALYSWLHATGGFGITEDGLIVGYKGVRKDDAGKYWSITRGYAIVDGVEVNGSVPNEPGSVITMPRSQVAFDRNTACSTGLHIGTWEYASTFGSVVLKVLVNPRDVVSVPYDSGAQKIRACAYVVSEEVTEKDDSVLFTTGDSDLPQEELEEDNSLYATFENEEEDEYDDTYADYDEDEEDDLCFCGLYHDDRDDD